jgi:hypothetical protein
MEGDYQEHGGGSGGLEFSIIRTPPPPHTHTLAREATILDLLGRQLLPRLVFFSYSLLVNFFFCTTNVCKCVCVCVCVCVC